MKIITLMVGLLIAPVFFAQKMVLSLSGVKSVGLKPQDTMNCGPGIP